MNKPARVWRFAKATEALLRRRKLKGHALQIWTGHYTALCGLTPWGLSALQHVYRFIESAGDKRIAVWPSVRRELKIAGSLVWMTWRQLTSLPMKVVEAGDSSTSGFAMMACYPDASVTREAMRTHERWRFIAMPDELKNFANAQDVDAFQDALRGLLFNGEQAPVSGAPEKLHDDRIFRAAGLDTGYAQTVVDAMKEGSLLKTSAVRSQVRAKPRSRVDIEVPALVQPLNKFFADERNFRLLWARRWKRVGEHITLKEMRVCLSSLRRASRVTELHAMRKLTLCDNLAVVSAFSKGRATNGAMNALCKQASALQFCTGIVWSVRHIESGRNPADRPSRFFEKRGRAVGKVPVNGVNYFGGGSDSGACSSSKPKECHSHCSIPSVFPRGHGKFFLELFSGTEGLTGAMIRRGVSTVDAVDYVKGIQYDVRRHTTQQLILQWISKGIFGFIHLGTPCTIWSRARHGVKDSEATRSKEELGVEMALFTAEVINMCNKLGIPYALENPRTSKLFYFEPIMRAYTSAKWYVVDFDMCQYGEPYQKSTRIITSFAPLKRLARKCGHARHTTWLKGKTKMFDEKSNRDIYVNRTALAGAYPIQLCNSYAEVVSEHLALQSHDVVQVQNHWRASLRSAADRKAADRRSARKTQHLRQTDDQQLCELLQKHGGLGNFIDAIALGRPKDQAWKALREKDNSKNKSHRCQV